MEAAAKGAVTLDRPSDKSWTVTDTQGPQGWVGLDSVTQRVARLTVVCPGSALQNGIPTDRLLQALNDTESSRRTLVNRLNRFNVPRPRKGRT